MISVKKAGFTIIEVMLFLGISGILFVGIIVGTGSAINVQRYRDSVSSLQSVLQQQYSETSNVINDNADNLCSLDSSTSPRGQSDCVVLGRFITSTDGKKLSVKNVIGKRNIYNATSDDIQAFLQYNIAVSQVEAGSYDLEWGSFATGISATGHKDFSMLILRSPLSGVVRTFLNDDPEPTDEGHLINLLTTGSPPVALGKSVQLCIDPSGSFTGPKIAIMIGANSTNESGIQVLGEADQAKLGVDSVCR